MNEQQLREAIRGIIYESLNELSPDFYRKQAEKANGALNGYAGKAKRFINPKWGQKVKNQADRFNSYSEHHPDDTYDITDVGWANQLHDTGYKLRNNRTGKTIGFSDANDSIPIRGKVTNNGEYGREASWLNDFERINENGTKAQKLKESQLRKIISNAIRESLEEVIYGDIKA